MSTSVELKLPPRGTDEAREISLGELSSVLWRSKWLLLSVGLLAGALGFGIATFMTKKYTAVVLLSPVTSQSASSRLGALSDVASSFGGLGGLVGLGGAGSEQRAESIATLQSELLTETFISKNDLLPVLYEQKWDAAAKKWKSPDPRIQPTLWKANLFFSSEVRGVVENVKTGLITMTVSWKDPVLAASWANGLVKMTNGYLREKSILRSELNIRYLSEQAAKTSEVELRSAIYQLMQNEIKNEMISKGNEEYALKVIDPAVVPEKPTSPQRVLLAISSSIGAFLVCAVVVLVRRFPTTKRDSA